MTDDGPSPRLSAAWNSGNDCSFLARSGPVQICGDVAAVISCGKLRVFVSSAMLQTSEMDMAEMLIGGSPNGGQTADPCVSIWSKPYSFSSFPTASAIPSRTLGSRSLKKMFRTQVSFTPSLIRVLGAKD